MNSRDRRERQEWLNIAQRAYGLALTAHGEQTRHHRLTIAREAVARADALFDAQAWKLGPEAYVGYFTDENEAWYYRTTSGERVRFTGSADRPEVRP